MVSFKNWYLLCLIILVFLIGFVKSTFASENFTEKYDVSYDIGESGEALVLERVTIKNLSDSVFGTEYTTTIPVSQISDLSASDLGGPLKVTSQDEGAKKKITVRFSDQVIGKDKEYSWTLRYKSRDFLQKNGDVWQLAIPKNSPITNLERYNVTISVPLVFGDPAFIEPKPTRQTDAGSQVDYFYTKETLLDRGITAYFGKQQLFDLNLSYQLKNDGLLPTVKSLYLPATNGVQEVLINSIDPKPEGVISDKNGNTVAYFNLARREEKKITASLLVKLDLGRSTVILPSVDQLPLSLNPTPVWDNNAIEVQDALKIAFKDKNPKTVLEKAQLIYQYVTKGLNFGDYPNAPVPLPNNSASFVLSQDQTKNNFYCRDFVNVTIALLRGAQIPAQEVIGLAETNNKITRPTCFTTKELHSWVRFYDPQLGWRNIDPVWGTTSGVDYFDFSDLSHIALGNLDLSTINEEVLPVADTVAFSQQEFTPLYSVEPEISAPERIIAGFPYTVSFELKNTGNTTLPAGSVRFSGGKLKVVSSNIALGEGEYNYPEILPFGSILYSFKVKTESPFEQYRDQLVIKFGDKEVKKDILVQTFFSAPLFGAGVFGFVGLMFLLYILAIVLHYKLPLEELDKLIKKSPLLLPAPKKIKKQKIKKRKKQVKK